MVEKIQIPIRVVIPAIIIAAVGSSFIPIAYEAVSPGRCGVCSEAITEKSVDFVVAAGSVIGKVAQCDEGQKVTGGGYTVNADSRFLNVWDSSPMLNTGWSVSAANFGETERTITVYAICINITE